MATREISKASISVGNKDAVIAATHEPEYVGNTLVSSGTNNASIAIDVPTGTTTGDLLVAIIVADLGGSDRVTIPTGWIYRERSQDYAVATVIWDGVASSYTFTFPTSQARTGAILSFRKATIQTSSTVVFGSTATGDVTAPAITINYSPTLLISAIVSRAATQTFSTPSGWTQRIGQQTNHTLYVFTKDTLQPTGDTGTLTFTKTVGTTTSAAGQIGIYGI